MHRRINALEKGERVDGFYLIRSLNLKTSSNNNKYLDMTLADASGEINAKIWDVDEDIEQIYKPGDVIKVRGDVTLWLEQLQLKIIKTRPLEDDDDVDYDAIVSSAPLKSEVMLEGLKARALVMKNEELRRMACHALDVYGDKILYYPAAMKNHHAIRGGLLWHLTRMADSGEALCPIYDLDWDLLFTGILLHDLDKLIEMDSNDMGIVSGYTTEGILLGHIVTGVSHVREWADKLGVSEETSLMLQHMVLTHHYEPEYGSPKKPQFAEAELLHHLDMIDARMYDMKKAELETRHGEFSEPVFSLERRRVFRPSYKR